MKAGVFLALMFWGVAGHGLNNCSYRLAHVDGLAVRSDSIRLNAIETLIAEGSYEKAISMCRKEMYADNVSWQTKLKQHILLVTALNLSAQYEQALKETNILYASSAAALEKDQTLLREFFFQRAYTYSGLHNQKYEIIYTQKALAVMEANPKLFSTADFISTYNDLYYYQLNYDDQRGMEATYAKYLVFIRGKNGKLKTDEKAQANRVGRKMEVTIALSKDLPAQAVIILKRFIDEVRKPIKDSDVAYINSCFSHINNYYYFAGDYERSIAFAREYLSFARQTGSTFDVMLAYSKIGASNEQLGRYDQGIKYIDLSLKAFDFGDFSASEYALKMIKSKCLSGKERHWEACQLAEKTIEQILSHKLKKPTKISDFNVGDITDLNSHNYINIFATAGLLFIEKYKNHLQEPDLDKAEKLLRTSSAMFREFYLKGEYNSTLYNLQRKNAEGLLYIAAERYLNEQKQLIAILDIIEENSSQHLYKNYLRKAASSGKDVPYHGQKNLGTLIGATQLQLDKDEQLLKYYVLPKDIYLVQMDRKKVKLHRIAAGPHVRQAAMRFIENLGQLDPDYKKDGRHLASLLLPKGLSGKLTVIPDNFLNYLPFEALWMSGSKAFLVQQHQISYAYSIAMLNWNRNVKLQKDRKETLIFNPIYSQGANYQGLPLPQLPSSQKEANEIARTMDGTVVGGQVAKTDFLKHASDHSIYHFAMHAYLDQEEFNRSCLVFSKGEPLFFEELYQMRIPAELIVLGACNTGNGKLRNGEGIMSLATAFSFAGTRSSIFSLWKVPDKETAQVLGAFYGHLKKGLSKDEALALAKRDFIRKNPIKSHPFFWAGFIVNGDSSALFTKPVQQWLVYGAMILAISVLFIVFWRKLRN
jgi:hypothetical protein